MDRLTLEEMFAIVKDVNKKMVDTDGLNWTSLVSLEVVNGIDPFTGDDCVEGRMMFLGKTIWDSDEDSHNPKDIKEIIADEILSLSSNLELIAKCIKELVEKKEW
jgi:hypothetical protein